jgi:putative transcriptional regulator
MAKKTNRVVEAILETSSDLHRLGIMDDATYRKITIRHFGTSVLNMSEPVSGDEIRNLRKQAHLSQAAFAHVLNLTPGYVSQLERGVRKPIGPTLSLLNIFRRKGVAAILFDEAHGQGVAA